VSDDEQRQGNPGFYIPPTEGVWPGTIDTEGLTLLPPPTLEGTALSDEQDMRVSALYHARANLERRTVSPFGKGENVSPPSVPDLLRVAQWILTGDDSDQDR
jgi:hypothetical protein